MLHAGLSCALKFYTLEYFLQRRLQRSFCVIVHAGWSGAEDWLRRSILCKEEVAWSAQMYTLDGPAIELVNTLEHPVVTLGLSGYLMTSF